MDSSDTSDGSDDGGQEIVSLLLRRAALRSRRRAHDAQHSQGSQHTTGKRRHKRRGGWNPKPRHGSSSPSKSGTQDEWRFDTSKSIWWDLLNDPDTLVERSFAGQEFNNEFRMSRIEFDNLLAQAEVRFGSLTSLRLSCRHAFPCGS